MMLSAGAFVGWTMKRSDPRMFSSIRTKISPSAKRDVVTLHRSRPSQLAISSDSGLLAVPDNNLNPCFGTAIDSTVSCPCWIRATDPRSGVHGYRAHGGLT